MKKICNQCKIEKELKEFNKHNSTKDGYKNKCKICTSLNMKKYLSNPLIKEDFYNKNKKRNKDKYQNNLEERIYHYKNHKNWMKNNLEYYDNWRKNNRDKSRKASKKWILNNPNYHKEKRKNNPIFKIKENLRSILYQKFKYNNFKFKKSLELLGCSIEEYKLYLESQFTSEMTWENYGTIWEIDHIKSCASFDLTKLEEQQKCFNYLNTQPLFKTTEIAESFGYKNYIGNRNKGKNG